MPERRPLVRTGGVTRELPAADTLPLPAFGPSGPITGGKIWIGETTTTATGAWSVDLTQAGFTALPKIQVTALSADTQIGNSAVAVWTSRSLVAASGFVNLPNVIALGGMPEKRAGAGLTVSVLAIGP